MLKIKSETIPCLKPLSGCFCNQMYINDKNEILYLTNILNNYPNLWVVCNLTRRSTKECVASELSQIMVRDVPKGMELVIE